MTELDCYRHGCRGTLKACDGSDVLFRCDECESEIQQDGVEELAGMDDGPLAQLAETLLEKGR